MAIRNLLPTKDLEGFKSWVTSRGYIEHLSHPNAVYECLRISKGDNPHLVFYKRDHDGRGRDAKNFGNVTHITIPDDAETLVRAFLFEVKSNAL